MSNFDVLRAYASSMSGPIGRPTSTCLTCRGAFAQTVKKGRRRLYCSPECKVAREVVKHREQRPLKACAACGGPVEGHQGRKLCSQCRPSKRQHRGTTCWICNEPMIWHGAERPTCGSCRRKHGNGVCSKCGGPKREAKLGLCGSCLGRRSPSPEPKAPRICKLCADSFVPRKGARPDQGWCSKSCAQAWRNGARPPYVRVADGDYKSAKIARNRLRLRVRAATWDGVADAEIMERDRWRCGICGRRIGKSFRYPHPRSKSIDHVIPLSQGGDDTAANKRAAHLGCNQGRMNRGGGEQLALIG